MPPQPSRRKAQVPEQSVQQDLTVSPHSYSRLQMESQEPDNHCENDRLDGVMKGTAG